MRKSMFRKGLVFIIILLFVGASVVNSKIIDIENNSIKIEISGEKSQILDFVVTNLYDDDVGVYFGNGSGGFGNYSSYSVGNEPWGIVAKDFNCDSFLDIAATNTVDYDVTVLLGNGSGKFTRFGDFSVGTRPLGIASGDFNNDTFVDLVVTNHWGHDVSVLFGYGTGGFGSPQNYPVTQYPTRIVTGDFNGDSYLDLAITAQPLFSSDYVSVLLNDGYGEFGEHQAYSVGDGPQDIITSDFNGDGFLDLATASYDDDVVSVLMGDGSGEFGSYSSFSVGNGPRCLVTGDFDDDDVLDLAVTNNNDDDVSVLQGDGEGTFSDRMDFIVGDGPYDIVTGDFDDDDVLDLAVTNNNDDDVSIVFGNGSGGFGDRHDYPVGNYPFVIVLGNFNPLSENRPPYMPSNPVPEDDETNVSVNVNLSWTGGDPDGNEVTYDVYFGTNSPPSNVSSNQSNTTYNPGLLDFDTTYYWRIVTWDNFSAHNESPIWSFTTEGPEPDLDCEGSLSWIDVGPSATVTGNFTVENIGEPVSLLDWEVDSYPSWGEWIFIPFEGNDLTPEDGTVTVQVMIIAPNEQNTEFTGTVKIVNKHNSSDFYIIDVTLATPKNQLSIQSYLVKIHSFVKELIL